MTAARFVVDDAFSLASQGTFFVLGDVVEGQPRVGMTAAGPSFAEPIHAVETVDSRGRPWVALGFRYRRLAERDRWMAMEWRSITLSIPPAPILHPCPCCGVRTLTEAERGSFPICPVCTWEDDSVQYHDPDHRGGANGGLNEARAALLAAHPHLRPTHDG